jgi:hypothetical protein
MPRTAKRLFGPALITNSVATKYTVPASTKTIVRHIHIQNPSGSAVTITISIGTDAAGTRIFDAFSIPAAGAGVTGSVYDHFCYYVMEATEILQMVAGTTNILTATVDGEEITLG